jgi:hypothetical protein
LISVTLSLFITGVELAIPADYYGWINAVDYVNLSSACCIDRMIYSPLDVIDQNTTGLFNFGWDSASLAAATSFRFKSSLMNPVSYAYILALAGVAAISMRQYLWLIVIVPLLIAIGVKGAAILFFFSLCFWTILITTGSGRITFLSAAALLTLYVDYGLTKSLDVGDFHAIGFLGGWQGFLSNPLGHGLGVGGNLSPAAAKMPNWTGAGGMQSAGADFGLESAVGVLIYQMGIGSLAVFAVFGCLLKGAPLLQRKRQARDIWFLALVTVVVNGVFQEEAYAPTAAGLIAMMCAVVLMNERRQAVPLSSLPAAMRAASA